LLTSRFAAPRVIELKAMANTGFYRDIITTPEKVSG